MQDYTNHTLRVEFNSYDKYLCGMYQSLGVYINGLAGDRLYTIPECIYFINLTRATFSLVYLNLYTKQGELLYTIRLSHHTDGNTMRDFGWYGLVADYMINNYTELEDSDG